MDGGSHNGSNDVADSGELIASLFATRAPAVIMTLLFLMIGIVVSHAAGDVSLRILVVGGMIASVVRLIALTAGRRAMMGTAPTPPSLRVTMRRFSISYLVFAAIFGAFCARGMMVAPVEHLVLIGILMTGYAAGVAAGVTLCPRVAIAAISLATMPSALVAAARLDTVGVAMAVMLLAFLTGGLRSMQMRFRSETGRIALRQTYERLARQDHLTRIANRLGLEQRYDAGAAYRRGRRVVVHCLDLDGFKQVNDLHGHGVGDALLIAIAARLTTVSDETIAARLGGDEFVLVQFDAAADAPEAAQHALERRLSGPYHVEDLVLEIGVSIGTATGSTDQSLRELLREADLRQRLRKLERRRQNRGDREQAPAEALPARQDARLR